MRGHTLPDPIREMKLGSRLVQGFGPEEVFPILEAASIALAQRVVVIPHDAPTRDDIIGIQGSAVRELDIFFQCAGPFGAVSIRFALFGQGGLQIGRTPLEVVEGVEEHQAGAEGVAIGLISTSQGDGLSIL